MKINKCCNVLNIENIGHRILSIFIILVVVLSVNNNSFSYLCSNSILFLLYKIINNFYYIKYGKNIPLANFEDNSMTTTQVYLS